MKTSELIKLRLDTVALIYKHGSTKDISNMYTIARQMINFISTGNTLKKPVPDK